MGVKEGFGQALAKYVVILAIVGSVIAGLYLYFKAKVPQEVTDIVETISVLNDYSEQVRAIPSTPIVVLPATNEPVTVGETIGNTAKLMPIPGIMDPIGAVLGLFGLYSKYQDEYKARIAYDR